MTKQSFIPANESPWFICIFDLYVRFLFKRRFHRVYLNQHYTPENRRTIYYLNHTSWWDGLIPLLLNRKVFKQKARAMMEDTQMKEHPFFSHIGAFSINLAQHRASVASLRYAVTSLKRENACLFIYPEGKIYPFSTENITFKNGLSWIVSKTDDVDVVPIGIYMHTAASDKPELFLSAGNRVNINRENTVEEIRQQLENEMAILLQTLTENAHQNREVFKVLVN